MWNLVSSLHLSRIRSFIPFLSLEKNFSRGIPCCLLLHTSPGRFIQSSNHPDTSFSPFGIVHFSNPRLVFSLVSLCLFSLLWLTTFRSAPASGLYTSALNPSLPLLSAPAWMDFPLTSGESSGEPIAFAPTEFHWLILWNDRIGAVARLSGQFVWEEGIFLVSSPFFPARLGFFVKKRLIEDL